MREPHPGGRTGSPTRAATRERLERFARESGGSVLWDAERSLLYDVFSGKSLPLDLARVEGLHERKNAESGHPYLVVVRDDGRQIVLAEVGIAFEPLTASTGSLPDLPQVVCFRDLANAEGQLRHALVDHPGEEVTRSHLALFLFCLAIVDGARAVGLDVSAEERRLEPLLAEIEARRSSGP